MRPTPLTRRGLLLQRVPEDETLTGLADGDRFNGIRCPKCKWQPKASSRWLCVFCTCSWNTFDTRGRCPDCGYRWGLTVCLTCHTWSLHDEWYELRDRQPK